MSFPNTLQGDYGTWFETGAVALYPLGQRMLCPEGRIFRYVENGGTALVACTLVQAEAEDAAHDALAVQTQAVATDDHIHFTNSTAAISEDQFKYGYLSVDTANALGVAHRIAANTGTQAASTGTVFFFEGDTVQVTISTAKKITLRKSIYKDVIVTPVGEQTAIVVGVPQNAIVANGYGWVQTHGLGGVLCEGAANAIGEQVRPSEDASKGAGSVTNMQYNEANDAALGVVGWMCDANNADEKNANIFFTLEGAS